MCAASLVSVSMAATFTLTPGQFAKVPADGMIMRQVPQNALTLKKAAPAAESATTFDFTYASAPYTQLGFGDSGVGYEILQGFEITPEVATLYAGATVKTVDFYNPTTGDTEENSVKSATIYIMDKIDGNVLQQQEVELSKVAFEANHVELKEPIVMEAGQGFFVAVGMVQATADDYMVTFDYLAPSPFPGSWVGPRDNRGTYWSDYASELGNLNMGLTLDATAFPTRCADLYYAYAEPYQLLNEPFRPLVIPSNGAETEITSVELAYAIDDNEPATYTSTFEGLGYRDMIGIELPDIVCTQVGNHTINITITKVNGEANESVFPSTSIPIIVKDPNVGYKRTFVVEEGTGTWCGWCPAGIVFMEMLKENYPDVIRVAVHANQGDPMEVRTAYPVISMFTGFPSLYVNRQLLLGPTSEDVNDTFDEYYSLLSRFPAPGEITALSIEPADGNKMTINAKARFAEDAENLDGRYGIVFSITEDGMGPYVQTNYYAGGAYGMMGGWGRKGSAVPTVYDDVLRVYAGGLGGFDEIFPEALIKAEQEYEFSTEVNCSTVYADDFVLNAYIVDNDNGEIINAMQVTGHHTGVEGISADAANVAAEEYYNLNGIRVEKPENGIFVKRTVMTDGSVRHSKIAK